MQRSRVWAAAVTRVPAGRLLQDRCCTREGAVLLGNGCTVPHSSGPGGEEGEDKLPSGACEVARAHVPKLGGAGGEVERLRS